MTPVGSIENSFSGALTVFIHYPHTLVSTATNDLGLQRFYSNQKSVYVKEEFCVCTENNIIYNKRGETQTNPGAFKAIEVS